MIHHHSEMMGSRSQSTIKHHQQALNSKQHQHSQRLKTNKLFASSPNSSSDRTRIEGSFSGGSSSNSTNGGDNVYLIQNNDHKHHQLQYVNNDGAIFTLASNTNYNCNTNKQQVASSTSSNNKSSSYHHLQDLYTAANQHHSPSSSKSNLIDLNTPVSSTIQQNLNASQQHRKLQYEVHQQLQKIYGSKQQQSANLNPSASERHKFLLSRHKQQINQRQDYINQQQSKTSVDQPSVNSKNPIMSNHHPNSIPDQTYDSLNSNSLTKHIENYYDLNSGLIATNNQNNVRQHNHHHHHHLQPISAIPEECIDDIIAQNEEEEEVLLISDTLPHHHHHHHRQLAKSNQNTLGPSNAARSNGDRKSQLENLHYATVTAAALLNATANAAAAIAATEKQFADQSSRVTTTSNDNRFNRQPATATNNSIYSDTYQEIRKLSQQQRCQSEPRRNLNNLQQQQQLANLARYKQHSYNFENHIRRQLPTTVGGASTSAIYGPIIRSSASASHQFYRPNIPPQPPARTMMNPNQINVSTVQAELMRQQQQRAVALQSQQQSNFRALAKPTTHPVGPLRVPPMPALAIVHHNGGKNASMKADLIGRLLMNNMLQAAAVAQNNRHQQLSSNDRKLINDQQLAAYNRQIHQVFAGNGSKDKQLYATTTGLFAIPTSAAANVAGSDTSGSSNVPLVLDRKLKKVGIIERVCRIDLTLFWWSLSIVSFFFMSIVIAISRYIF